MSESAEKPNPVFVIGAPRSGTTLLRVMLNRHSQIGLCDETYFFYYVYGRRRAFGDLRHEANRRRLVESYLTTNRIGRLGFDSAALADVLIKEGTSYPTFFAVLLRHYARERKKSIYGEKTPDHALVAQELCRWYRSCRIIHLVRDPRDVVASLLNMPWASSSVLANARHWLRNTRSAHACSGMPNYHLLRYEDLVTAPQQRLADICSFLGVEFEEKMLVADEAVGTDKWWFERAQRPIESGRLETWREQLTPGQVGLIEWVVASDMTQFGYVPDGRNATLSSRAGAFVSEGVHRLRARIQKIPTMWYYWFRPTSLRQEEAWGFIP